MEQPGAFGHIFVEGKTRPSSEPQSRHRDHFMEPREPRGKRGPPQVWHFMRFFLSYFQPSTPPFPSPFL